MSEKRIEDSPIVYDDERSAWIWRHNLRPVEVDGFVWIRMLERFEPKNMITGHRPITFDESPGVQPIDPASVVIRPCVGTRPEESLDRLNRELAVGLGGYRSLGQDSSGAPRVVVCWKCGKLTSVAPCEFCTEPNPETMTPGDASLPALEEAAFLAALPAIDEAALLIERFGAELPNFGDRMRSESLAMLHVREKLERDIRELVIGFEKATGLDVKRIKIEGDGKFRTVNVTVPVLEALS